MANRSKSMFAHLLLIVADNFKAKKQSSSRQKNVTMPAIADKLAALHSFQIEKFNLELRDQKQMHSETREQQKWEKYKKKRIEPE